MSLKSVFVVSSGTLRMIMVMSLLTLLCLLAVFLYYRDLNRRADPRVVEAKIKFTQYNDLIKGQQYAQALNVLDEIESIYLKVPGYSDSFEMGVVYNNKGSVYLIQTETQYLVDEKGTDPEILMEYLNKAQNYIETSIQIYEDWNQRMGHLDQESVYQSTIPYFDKDDPAFDGYQVDKLISRRVEELLISQTETNRRLSVSYTNLGIVSRYKDKPEDAKKFYEKAILLWAENHTAKNNLRVLSGQPIQERGVLEKLFPQERIQ
ncbi:MAG: hypothetical protein HQM12_18805 [SAR324 cluster bacterium]|nr:hypothetical protein [SAR324 cluster bacterium]